MSTVKTPSEILSRMASVGVSDADVIFFERALVIGCTELLKPKRLFFFFV